jgi:hypothetical protein
MPHLYRNAVSAWMDADPDSATDFKVEVALAQQRSEFEEKFSPALEVPGQLAEKDRQASLQNAFNTAWGSLNSKHPDLDEYTDSLKEAIETAPAVARVLQAGDPLEIEQTLALYLNDARYRREQAQKIGAAQESEAADAAKSKANLTKSSATAGSQSKPTSSGAKFLEIFDEVAGFSKKS